MGGTNPLSRLTDHPVLDSIAEPLKKTAHRPRRLPRPRVHPTSGQTVPRGSSRCLWKDVQEHLDSDLNVLGAVFALPRRGSSGSSARAVVPASCLALGSRLRGSNHDLFVFGMPPARSVVTFGASPALSLSWKRTNTLSRRAYQRTGASFSMPSRMRGQHESIFGSCPSPIQKSDFR
jgi:hypothetical protein